MNKKIGMAGSLINAVMVALFALFMLIRFNFGSYFVCILLSISYMAMIAAIDAECTEEKKAAGRLALVFSAVYSTLIMIVYYTQCTTVHNETLGTDAAHILNYSYMGLMFNLDLLGYGIMALSTFFAGLALNVRNKKDKVLKILLILHGLFFFGCFLMPMTGMFLGGDGSTSMGGVIALEIWCAYFLPIGILSFMHFKAAE
jgi:hypothetical protein